MEARMLTYDSAEDALARIIALVSDLPRADRPLTRVEILQAIIGTLDLRPPAGELLPLRRSRAR